MRLRTYGARRQKKTPRARNISPLLGRKRNDVLLHVQLKPQVKWGAVSLPKAHDHNSCHQLLPTDREAGWSTKPHRMMLPPLNALSPFPWAAVRWLCRVRNSVFRPNWILRAGPAVVILPKFPFDDPPLPMRLPAASRLRLAKPTSGDLKFARLSALKKSTCNRSRKRSEIESCLHAEKSQVCKLERWYDPYTGVSCRSWARVT